MTRLSLTYLGIRLGGVLMTRFRSVKFRELLQVVQKALGDEPNRESKLRTRRPMEGLS